MKQNSKTSLLLFLILCGIFTETVVAQTIAEFHFNGNIKNTAESTINSTVGGGIEFGNGLEGKSLKISPENNGFVSIQSENQQFNNQKDFSIQFWIKTDFEDNRKAIILSTKDVPDYSLVSQKKAGWSMSVSNGTFAWNVGSGTRRLTYLRDNGKRLPLNDGDWHLLTLTFSSNKQEFRLYYDGINRAIYTLGDAADFNFSSNSQLVLGWNGKLDKPNPEILPEIARGAKELQLLVDEFNRLNIGNVESYEFLSLIAAPKDLFKEKVNVIKNTLGADTIQFLEKVKSIDLESLLNKRKTLMQNPFTVYQNRNFLQVAPLLQIYGLNDGKVFISKGAARKFTKNEKLHEADYEVDNLRIWNHELQPEEIEGSYTEYFKSKAVEPEVNKDELVVADWNIWHGGIHKTVEKDGIDSRMRIINMLKEENADVIMMQETYSSGDFIAAELGYYFTTTADWDYLNQGSNLSVLSRYPIKEIYVPEGASFMNIAAKVAISETQDVFVMSNWYGMNQFPVVFDFHKSRFDESDSIPVLFGGDFNAIPHTDGGNSPASKKMLEYGFIDAYRSLYPNVKEYPGYTHEWGDRIDQIYYKGKGLTNSSTKVISTGFGGFPSDHHLIISKFKLN